MVDANGYGEETETLALRKGLDSGSDVAGSARWWIRFVTKVKCQILAPGLRLALVVRFPKILAFSERVGFLVKCEILVLGLGLALVGKFEIEVQDYGGVLDANDYGEGTETLALLKELGPGSDVTVSARWWIKF
ncbi:Unconventional Myosin-Xv, partial [Manis pentadactyla]